MSEIVIQSVLEKFADQVIETHSKLGDDTIVLKRDRLLELLYFLRDGEGMAFDMPIDLTVVDWYRKQEPRFEVVYHLYSTTKKHRIRLKVQVDEDDPVVASSNPVWPGFDWYEREAYDLYGIEFEGHPKHERILMWEGFEGHPLRKDYPINKRQPLTTLVSERADELEAQGPEV
ncbi:MAG: NADH-quinone oxidoreductase subunit C [Bradymonadia bacterium]